MILQAIKSTDGQYLGTVFELPDPLMKGFDYPVSADVVFNVENSKQLPNGDYEYWNDNYILVAREVV